MKRNCDICGIEYNVRKADLDRGWGLTCSKSCAASKREKSRDDYDILTVDRNNKKRELWHNKYRNREVHLRRKHKSWSDEQIWEEMFNITGDTIFLSEEAKDIFIF